MAPTRGKYLRSVVETMPASSIRVKNQTSFCRSSQHHSVAVLVCYFPRNISRFRFFLDHFGELGMALDRIAIKCEGLTLFHFYHEALAHRLGQRELCHTLQNRRTLVKMGFLHRNDIVPGKNARRSLVDHGEAILADA